jgi:lipopolysaccharide/colanic/teichoic acid biosynthesis glycosyltransferase
MGDMSLIGPRPHAIAHNEYYAAIIDGYLGRHRVKPGITGWAQVNGLRGETATVDAMHDRVKHDLYYIENWSLALDCWILVRTLAVGFVHRNAY